MQDYGVNLICVEDGIDSSKETGNFILSKMRLGSFVLFFPVYYNGAETQEVDLSDSSWDYQRSLECTALLQREDT